MKESRYNVWVEKQGRPAVFNGMSGKLIIMRPGERGHVDHFIQTGDLGLLAPDRAEQLVRARAIISDDVDELAVIDARQKLARYDATHLGFTLVTSLGCNFDCPYCYESKHPAIMSEEVQDAVCAIIDDRTHLNDLSVTWIGGEPLVGKKALLSLSDKMIERCEARGASFDAQIITNGWHLTRETCQQLADRHVSFAQVTMDGPPDVHNVMRPKVGGGETFDRILENLTWAHEYLNIGVRVNIDESNLHRAEELLQILHDKGLSGKLFVECAKMTYYDDNPDAPVKTYGGRCYPSPEYADVELEFQALCHQYGLGGPDLPSPKHAACEAVMTNEIIVGAEGELWKCWDEIGNAAAVYGDVRTYADVDNDRLRKWLTFNPAEDSECSTCIALPGCMGGCLHHTLAGQRRDAQCGTFRYNYREQVERVVTEALGDSWIDDATFDMVAASAAASPQALVPEGDNWQTVSIGPRSSIGVG